ncbi:hypothetical protein CERZMDRAFT_99475 [Cercospora zeae-maydis SCOH1-5]|uniref:Uncharacterized protein n=1 Tax=Cercospora zeae-maydis SCOH1-5 TaxID=717836 RepID=A0A6A6FAH2_9PEZI|nr:hypothetical protein CERZMDRAFT_99475 [Cercospora zeae-maydis SCOH1-5]
MSTIYRKAVHVLVPLAPSSDQYSVTARQISSLQCDPAWAAWDADAPPAWTCSEDQSASERRTKILEKWFNRTSSVHRLPRIREQLRQIALLPYWTRVWVVQEISLAGVVRLMLGDDIIHWRSLSEFYKFISSRSPKSAPPLPLALQYASKLPERLISTEQSSPKVLQTFSMQQCSDPRDRVYGLLTLIKTLKYGAQADEVLKLMRCWELEQDLEWHVSARRRPIEPFQRSPFWTRGEEYHDYVHVHPMSCHFLTHDAESRLRLPFHPVRNQDLASDKEKSPTSFSSSYRYQTNPNIVH